MLVYRATINDAPPFVAVRRDLSIAPSGLANPASPEVGSLENRSGHVVPQPVHLVNPLPYLPAWPLPRQLSGNAGAPKQVRYQANEKQNDEDEKANSGYLSRSKSYDSKTEKTGDQGDYKKDQRIVEHGAPSCFQALTPSRKQLSYQLPKFPVFNAEPVTHTSLHRDIYRHYSMNDARLSLSGPISKVFR